MRRFGVKLWSKDFIKNPEFARQSIEAVKSGYFEYIELFAIPDTYKDLCEKIGRELSGLKVIIHAPHSVFGVDTGNKERFEQNCRDLDSSFRFADLLKSEIIIIHPGFEENDACFEESLRQFRLLNDKRIVVENMPAQCSSTKRMLHGTSPAQIERFIKEVGCGFCLDFSHAVCAANHYGRDCYQDLAAYQKLNPRMYHMCDSDWHETEDKHLHYGEGNYPLSDLLNEYTNSDTFITMETGRGIPTDITPWIQDIKYLRNLLLYKKHLHV